MASLDLQEFLPYLMNRAGLRVGMMFSRDIEPLGVTLPMWRVMVELWRNGDHRLVELSERTSIDLSTLSRLLVTMQKKRLVVRERSGKDGRALRLNLTERGLELTRKIAPRALRYEVLATRGMKPRDIAKLKRLLQQVHENLEEAEKSGSPAAGRLKRGTQETAQTRGARA